MTDRPCSTCRHMRIKDHEEQCASPQIHAAFGGATRARFERDTYTAEYGRNTEAKRKCGTEGLNWERMP